MNSDDFYRLINEQLAKQLAYDIDKTLTTSLAQTSEPKVIDPTTPTSTPTQLTSGGVYAPQNVSINPSNISSGQGQWVAANVLNQTMKTTKVNFGSSKMSNQYNSYFNYPSAYTPVEKTSPKIVYSICDERNNVIFQVWDDGVVRGDQFEAAKTFYDTLEFEGKTLHRKIEELENQLTYAKSALKTINDTLTTDDTSPKAKHIKMMAEKTLDLLKK